jgi:hypothetical protein
MAGIGPMTQTAQCPSALRDIELLRRRNFSHRDVWHLAIRQAVSKLLSFKEEVFSLI